MSNWGYVTIAYTIVWGSLAGYAVLLARRVAQARRVASRLQENPALDDTTGEQESMACDVPPAP